MRETFSSLVLLVLLQGCGGSSGGTDLPPEGGPQNPQFGMSASVVSDEEGVATTSFGGREADVLLTDADSGEAVLGVLLRTIELTTGTFVWTESSEGDYFPGTDFVPLTAEGDLQLRMPVVTLRIPVVATAEVGSAVFEYTVDPPGIERVIGDVDSAVGTDGVVRECLVGDLGDVFGAGGVPGLADLTTGVIRVAGTPASMRGAAAINTGFTRAGLSGDLFAAAFEDALGILDADTQTICWPVVNGNTLPILEVTVEREVSAFDIVEIISPSFYPFFPIFPSVTTSFDVSWSGSPQFPVTLDLINNTCFPNVNCVDSSFVIRDEMNPIEARFGCVGSVFAPRSGFLRWTVTLTDSNGTATSPGTFSMRCGSDPG